jgi:L-threonylcarbamoyladenylate synthase
MRVFHTQSLSEREFDRIVSVLRAGGVVGFPTDTAYGLAADPFNDEAVATIFRLKGRAETKPILLLVDSVAMAERITQPNPGFYDVAQTFWPGPLTIVMTAAPTLSEKVTAGTGTVGVRWPVTGFATELVRRFGNPVTASSANRSGEATCVTAAEVQAQLGVSLEVLVDGGELPARSGSTLLDLTTDPPRLLRDGPVSFDSLRKFFGGNIRRVDG